MLEYTHHSIRHREVSFIHISAIDFTSRTAMERLWRPHIHHTLVLIRYCVSVQVCLESVDLFPFSVFSFLKVESRMYVCMYCLGNNLIYSCRVAIELQKVDNLCQGWTAAVYLNLHNMNLCICIYYIYIYIYRGSERRGLRVDQRRKSSRLRPSGTRNNKRVPGSGELCCPRVNNNSIKGIKTGGSWACKC